MGTAAELAELEVESLPGGFAGYLASWAKSSVGLVLLQEVAERVIGATYESGVLSAYFHTDNHGDVPVHFGPPYSGDFANAPFPVPPSYQEVVRMHNSVVFDRGLPDFVEMMGCKGGQPASDFMLVELGGDPTRHQGFCEVGENWLIFDHARTNALGEPVMVYVDASLGATEWQDFPGQQNVAFGVGGTLLRMLAHFVVGKDPLYEDYGWE